MRSNSAFNLLLIIICLCLLGYFIMQLLNPTTDDDEENDIMVRNPVNTRRKNVTFADPISNEFKIQNEHVIDYEPLINNQESSTTPLPFQTSQQKSMYI